MRGKKTDYAEAITTRNLRLEIHVRLLWSKMVFDENTGGEKGGGRTNNNEDSSGNKSDTVYASTSSPRRRMLFLFYVARFVPLLRMRQGECRRKRWWKHMQERRQVQE